MCPLKQPERGRLQKEGTLRVGETRSGKEQRSFALTGVEVRAADGAALMIVGHAAVFNARSEDLGGFREKIAPGAFTRTIATDDIHAVWNHDERIVLGRKKSGTLRLAEDEQGLAIENDAPDTQYVRDVVIAPIKRGDVDQMSFMFQTIEDAWNVVDGENVRTLLEVKLFEVSPVTFPAYPQTDVSARSLLTAVGLDLRAVAGALVRAERRLPSLTDDRDLLRAALDALTRATNADPTTQTNTAGASASLRHSRQRLVEATL